MNEKILSGILGLCVGDALGVPVEFVRRDKIKLNPVIDMIGYGTFNMPSGTWSDDTSLALCLLDYTVPNCQDKFFAIQSIFDKPCGIRKYCQCGWEDRATLASDPSAHAAAVRYEGRATAPFLYRQR